MPLDEHKDEAPQNADGELDPNPTIAEDWDDTEVQKEVSRYQGCLQRRSGRLPKETQAVEDQKALIAVEQAKLVELQSQLDRTKSQI